MSEPTESSLRVEAQETVPAGCDIPAGCEAEFVAMRAEILTRIQLRQRITGITLTLSGVLLGFGLQAPLVALLYPPLAAFLAFAWAQNDDRIRGIAMYIIEVVEKDLPGVRWESWYRKNSSAAGLSSWRYIVLAYGGILLFTQAFSVLRGLVWLLGGGDPPIGLGDTVLGWSLLVADAIAIPVVCWILRKALRKKGKR